jgi:hypothetical protein
MNCVPSFKFLWPGNILIYRVPWDVKNYVRVSPIEKTLGNTDQGSSLAILTDSNALYVFLGGNDVFPHHRCFSVFGVTLTNLSFLVTVFCRKLYSFRGIMFQMQETGFHVTSFMTIIHKLFWSPVMDSALHTTQQNI